MRIPEIDDTISICHRHLDATGAWGTEIETFLTRYVLVRIRANFEARIHDLIAEPLQAVNDEYVVSLAEQGIRRVFRSARTSHISEMLGEIGPDLRDEFRNCISGTRREQSFNTIAIQRNQTAHTTGASLTFRELVEHYDRAHQVLDDLRESIKTWSQ